METQQYVCNKANTHVVCNECYHAKPHDRTYIYSYDTKSRIVCTQWDSCCTKEEEHPFDVSTYIKVRCIKVKHKTIEIQEQWSQRQLIILNPNR